MKKNSYANRSPAHAYTRAQQYAAREALFWRTHFPAMLPGNGPSHLAHGRFWSGEVDDEQVSWLAARFHTIGMLDIYEAPITRVSIRHLTKVGQLKELRLKDCVALQDDCVVDLEQIQGLELLHLGGTSVTLNGLLELRGEHLKTVFLSSELPAPAIRALLQQLALSLPGCEIVVNHQPPHVYLEGV